MLSADYYISDIIRATEGIKRQLAERDERIRLLTEGQNLGGYKPLVDFPIRNLTSRNNIPTLEELSEFIGKVEQTRTANTAIIAHNQRVKEAIVVFMESMGFKKERSSGGWAYGNRKPKVTVNGWYGEIDKQIPISDDGEYHRCTSYISEIRKLIAEDAKNRERAELEAKREAEQEARAKAAHAHLIQTCIKYNLSAVNLEELRDALMGRCKYLELAWHLQQNSYNYDAGFDEVKDALSRFETDQKYGSGLDIEILTTIENKIENSPGDSVECLAMFPYSYVELYGMVDPALKADFDKTVEYLRA